MPFKSGLYLLYQKSRRNAKCKCGLGFAKAIVGVNPARGRAGISQNLGIYFLKFGGVKFCPQEGFGEECGLLNTNTIHCLGLVTYFYFGGYLEFRVAPSASASGISARATRA